MCAGATRLLVVLLINGIDNGTLSKSLSLQMMLNFGLNLRRVVSNEEVAIPRIDLEC